jgi:hypothetical protein
VDSEAALRQRFAGIGIEAGKPFDAAALPPAEREAITAGIADANQALEQFVATEINTGKVSSADMFGTRAALKDNYLYRFAGAKLGIYGNSASEADYQSYFVDAQGRPADGSPRRRASELRSALGSNVSPSIALVATPSRVRTSSWVFRSVPASSSFATPAISPCVRRAAESDGDRRAESHSNAGQPGCCQIHRLGCFAAMIASLSEVIIGNNHLTE